MFAYTIGHLTVIFLFLGIPAIVLFALHTFKRKSDDKKRDILGKVQIGAGVIAAVWYAFMAYAIFIYKPEPPKVETETATKTEYVYVPVPTDVGEKQTDSQSAEQTNHQNEPLATVDAGTYRVGTDIRAGEYKVTATDSNDRGYWKVTNDSSPDADIVGNDAFTGTSYVTVSEGQYLTLDRSRAELVE